MSEVAEQDLSARGTPLRLSGAELRLVGMPIGGLGCGQLYLGGDGRLWLWDVDNRTSPAAIHDLHFTRPPVPSSPFEHGFAVRIGGQAARWLDARDFPDATFTGRPPLAEVDYPDPQVRIRLRACSPFVPTEIEEIIVRDLFNGEYFVHELDPAHPGSVNTNRGCFADQLLGQSWAAQLGLPRVLPEAETRSALRSIWRHNFVPRPLEYREHSPIEGGRIFYDADVPALIMCTWPRGGGDEAGGNWSVSYFNEAWHGIEYQVAAHLIAEGMLDEGLAITRSVHDRYAPQRRNPYNEIECGDHYARSMASFGVYTSLLGFEHHGPRGHLGFAPKITPENFAAAFTTAEGWGLYRQKRTSSERSSTIELRHGRLRLNTLALDTTSTEPRAWLDGAEVPLRAENPGHPLLVFPERLTITAGQTLQIQL